MASSKATSGAFLTRTTARRGGGLLTVLLAAILAMTLTGGSPAAAGTPPPGCPTFDVFSEAELNAAITCFNSTSTPGTWNIDLLSDITYTGAGTIINNSTNGVNLVIRGNGFKVDAAGNSSVFRVFQTTAPSFTGTVRFIDLELTGGDGFFGGGVFTSGGNVTVEDSLLTGNTASNGGGAATTGGSLTILNSTVSGNTATGNGGGLHNEGTAKPMTVAYSTVMNNSAPTGSGISTWGSNSIATPANGTRITTSIVAANLGGGSQLELAYETTKDTFSSGGFNIIGSVGTGMTTPSSPDLLDNTPGLSTLSTRNGAYPFGVHYPLPGSEAIDFVTGTPNFFGAIPDNFDQAGFPRGIGDLTPDAGAAEGWASITVIKDANPKDGTDFSFSVRTDTAGGFPTIDEDFLLDDAVPDDGDGISSSVTFVGQTSSTLNVAESVDFGAGWRIRSATCTGLAGSTSEQSFNAGSLELSVPILIGEDVECTFVNVKCPTGNSVFVTDFDQLNNAIECFNETTTPGTYTINVLVDILYDGKIAPIDNSTAGVELTILTAGTAELNANRSGLGTAAGSVIDIDSGVVSIIDLELTGGNRNGGENGGGINNEGTLTLDGVDIFDNYTNQDGGGVWSSGDLTIDSSTIRDNEATRRGGGIAIAPTGSLDLSASFVVDNAATAQSGGGIELGSSAISSITFTTVTGNTAGLDGGGINQVLGSRTTIANSVITDNEAVRHGAGIALQNGRIDLVTSTVSTNRATGPAAAGGGVWNNDDFYAAYSTITANEASLGAGIASVSSLNGSSQTGNLTGLSATIVGDNGNNSAGDDLENQAFISHDPFITGDYNVIGSLGANVNAFNGSATDLVNTDPLLLPLATFSSGGTPHHRPSESSPAVDLVTGTPNLFGVPDPSALDQLNTTRPQGPFDDAGAIEVRPTALTIIDGGCGIYNAGVSGDGPLVPGTIRTVNATTGCVPSGATAIVVSIEAAGATGIGNFRLSTAGVAPEGGVVNYAANGLFNSNTVTVPLSAAGQLDIAAVGSAATPVLTAVGYYSFNGTLEYTPVTPCAIADSRTSGNPTGAFIGPFEDGDPYPDVDVAGTFNLSGDNQGGGQTDCLVPNGAAGVIVNVVAIGATDNGGLALGSGGTEPAYRTTSFAGIGLNNSATTMVPLDANGRIALNITGGGGLNPDVHVRLVVLGYFSTSGDSFAAVNPCAAFDSRTGSFGFGGFRLDGQATTYDVTGSIDTSQGGEASCNVPDGATAVLVNLVAIQPNSTGNFRAYAAGSLPTGGVLTFQNLVPAMNNSNAVVVPLDAAGKLDLFVNTPGNAGVPTVHVRGVILGYYS